MQVLVAMLMLFFAASSHAFETSHHRLQISVFTKHLEPKPYRVNQQNLVNVEWWLSDGRHAGVAFFDNSFGQFSQYLYVGKTY